MKRTLSQRSITMSPGVDSEGFDARQNGHLGNDVELVTIVGAGPAGLMLGQAYPWLRAEKRQTH